MPATVPLCSTSHVCHVLNNWGVRTNNTHSCSSVHCADALDPHAGRVSETPSECLKNIFLLGAHSDAGAIKFCSLGLARVQIRKNSIQWRLIRTACHQYSAQPCSLGVCKTHQKHTQPQSLRRKLRITGWTLSGWVWESGLMSEFCRLLYIWQFYAQQQPSDY